jgi:UDP-2,3-diacylglucosamine pyrophosphatase LpxH
MKEIKIIHLSDIHYDKNEPENQGLVLNSFFNDLEGKEQEFIYESTYCIISGDLVNAGASDKAYNEFYQNFISRLVKIVPIKNIYCTPGNHDLNRNIFQTSYDEHNKKILEFTEEIKFNDYVKTEDNILLKKFEPFKKFSLERLNSNNFNLYGYSENLIPQISVFFLNSALCSYGGYNKIIDDRFLRIETSELNKWLHENVGRKKMLVMHHPLEHLTSFAQKELKSMLNNGIDILINGHIHDQEIISNANGHINCCSPQLFSDKNDLQGYSIFTFNDSHLDNIEYRQWVQRHRKFMNGSEFTGNESGKYIFTSKKEEKSEDFITRKLTGEFNKSMKSYSQKPEWIERVLSTKAPNNSSDKKGEKLDYLDIINRPSDYQIIAGGQFGLTCYGKYLALKAWEIKKENWLYFDCHNWNLSLAISDMDDALVDFDIKDSDIKCLILDNWDNKTKFAPKILEKFKIRFTNIPFIILSNCHDSIVINGLDSEESHEGFTQLYLRELDKSGLRCIVKHFNEFQQIAEENVVLERLNLDLIDLNIHRTPLNCIQLLIAFLNNFENRPINRSNVFSYLLKVIFDNPGNLFYGNTLDDKNCIYILGNFCEHLLRNGKESFTEKEFMDISVPFCKENYNSTNIPDLLQVLKENQIFISFNGSLYFRFTYWIYYFAARRMKVSDEFASYMFNKKHSIYYPEIIEFYTGIDGAREDVVDMIITDLNNLIKQVHSKIGLKEDLKPFEQIKWALNETVTGMTQEQLEENVKKSKLPDEIKDVVADKEYDSVKPYNQTITKFFEDYDVQNLMNLTRSASRALRNSEFIAPKLKEDLAKSIFESWKEITRVIFLIAPVLAKNGFGGVGGARFQLTDNFPKDYSECLKKVIVMMPFNIMNWYKDDFFSDKLILLYKKFMIEFDDPTVRHIIALTISSGRPTQWQAIISEYIGSVGKNSYYLGDLYTSLCHNYSTKIMPQKELIQSENLIKACWAKHKTGSPLPGKGTISKISDSTLPSRNLKDLE